jgi:hypothetical protein
VVFSVNIWIILLRSYKLIKQCTTCQITIKTLANVVAANMMIMMMFNNLLQNTTTGPAYPAKTTKRRVIVGTLSITKWTSFCSHNHQISANAGSADVWCHNATGIAQTAFYREGAFLWTIRWNMWRQSAWRPKCGGDTFVVVWCHFQG